MTNVWPVWCYLYGADGMGCHHVIKRRVSGFDELCIRVRVCSFPCLLLCTSFSSLTHF